jgi:hypothetical protein
VRKWTGHIAIQFSSIDGAHCCVTGAFGEFRVVDRGEYAVSDATSYLITFTKSGMGPDARSPSNSVA